MGLLGYMAAGAAERAGGAVEKIGLSQIEANIREEAAKRLAEHTSQLQEGVQERSEQRGLVNRAQERETIFGETLTRAPQLADLEVDKQKKVAAAKLEADFAELQRLGPERIRQGVQQKVEEMRALSTPEMLKDARLQAQAKHIVDPSYAPLRLADGTVAMVDARTGKTTGTLKNVDGSDIVVKDASEQAAAVSSLQYANSALRIAEAKYKASISSMKGDITLDPKVKAEATATAEAEWQTAQSEARTLAQSALAVLNRKMKATPAKAKPGMIDQPESYPGGGSAKPGPLRYNLQSGKFE